MELGPDRPICNADLLCGERAEYSCRTSDGAPPIAWESDPGRQESLARALSTVVEARKKAPQTLFSGAVQADSCRWCHKDADTRGRQLLRPPPPFPASAPRSQDREDCTQGPGLGYREQPPVSAEFRILEQHSPVSASGDAAPWDKDRRIEGDTAPASEAFEFPLALYAVVLQTSTLAQTTIRNIPR